MLRNKLGLAVLAALMVAPVASQASILSRRLTIRYPGQDAPKRRHVHGESRRHDRREERRREERRREERRREERRREERRREDRRDRTGEGRGDR